MNFTKINFKINYITSITIVLFFFSTTVYGQSADSEQVSYPSYSLFGFVQQQFVEDLTPGSPAGFSIYRARLGVRGEISENISFRFLGGFVEPPQSNPQLVHAYMDYKINSHLNIRAGQFFAPFGIEGNQGIILNPAIERSLTLRRLNIFRMFSDIGVQAFGSWSRFNYAIALVNGTGANRSEQIDPKDFIGRVGFNLTEDLEIGLSGHAGHYLTGQNMNEERARYRAALDVNFKGDPLFVRGELVTRKDNITNSQNVVMNGGYLLTGYKVTDNFEAILRYEHLNPNSDVDDNRLEIITLGANYYLIGRSRLSVNYEFRDDKVNENFGNLFTVQIQFVF
ncbi:porin [Rhodohalobacter sp.]|uniref:porin n=1 Tax=Rhodohalobacter sp. TaxID=1974210 RepID=UPI003564D01A